MKIRMDFVTNSSSSSFVIAYNTEEDLADSISTQIASMGRFMGDYEYLVETILKDIGEEAKTYDEIKSIVEDEVKGKSFYAWCKEVGYSRMFEESEEKNKFIQNYIAKHTKKILDSLKEYKEFAYISYSDNDGGIFSDLEHHITPNLEECKATFNHH